MFRAFRLFLDSIKFSRLKTDQILKGKDYLGNTYYEKISADSSKRPVRMVVPEGADLKEIPDASPVVPPEWDSWLRFRRKEAPTEEEIEMNLAVAEMKKRRAAEKSGKSKTLPDNLTDAGTTVKTAAEEKAFPTYTDYEATPGEEKKPR